MSSHIRQLKTKIKKSKAKDFKTNFIEKLPL